MIVTGLAGCGGTTTATIDPTSTTAAASDVSTAPTDTIATGSMETPTQPSTGSTDQITPTQALMDQSTPTQAPVGASDQVTPTQAMTGQGGTSGSATGTQIKATLKEWAIDLSQKEVSAGKITFSVTNEGVMRHNLTVMDSNGGKIGQTSTFASSEGAQTLAVDLQPGTYNIICSLPGHAQRGQQTTLVVK